MPRLGTLYGDEMANPQHPLQYSIQHFDSCLFLLAQSQSLHRPTLSLDY